MNKLIQTFFFQQLPTCEYYIRASSSFAHSISYYCILQVFLFFFFYILVNMNPKTSISWKANGHLVSLLQQFQYDARQSTLKNILVVIFTVLEREKEIFSRINARNFYKSKPISGPLMYTTECIEFLMCRQFCFRYTKNSYGSHFVYLLY